MQWIILVARFEPSNRSIKPSTDAPANSLVIGFAANRVQIARNMDTQDKSEYVVAGIAAIILLEILTVALMIGVYFGRALS
jgi:hypothetical protein